MIRSNESPCLPTVSRVSCREKVKEAIGIAKADLIDPAARHIGEIAIETGNGTQTGKETENGDLKKLEMERNHESHGNREVPEKATIVDQSPNLKLFLLPATHDARDAITAVEKPCYHPSSLPLHHRHQCIKVVDVI